MKISLNRILLIIITLIGGFTMQTLASDIVIRPLQVDDWKKFRELRLSALRESPKAYGISEADESSKTDDDWKTFCLDSQNGNEKWFVIAESTDGTLVGMLGAFEISGEHMRHQVEIVQAYVSPQYRKLNIMKKMFFFLKESLQQVNHLEQMIVWVTLHETQQGKEMFESFGFKLAGTLSKTVKYKDKYYDCCWLESPL